MSQNGNGREFSTIERKALTALLECPTVTAAAEQCGRSKRTLHRYLSDPDFLAELRRLQDKTITAATSALSGLVGSAIETLGAVLTDEEASHATRVRAAAIILAERRKASELDDLARRLDDFLAAEELGRQWQD